VCVCGKGVRTRRACAAVRRGVRSVRVRACVQCSGVQRWQVRVQAGARVRQTQRRRRQARGAPSAALMQFMGRPLRAGKPPARPFLLPRPPLPGNGVGAGMRDCQGKGPGWEMAAMYMEKVVWCWR